MTDANDQPEEQRKPVSYVEFLVGGITILVVIALAIPMLLTNKKDERRRYNMSSLKTLGTAEIDFQANDRDGDRINNFWTDDVQGLYDLNDVTGTPIRLIEVTIARADGDVGGQPGPNGRAGIIPAPPAPKSGYWYVAFDNYDVPPGSPDPGLYDQDGFGHHNSRWAFMAKPDVFGSGARSHFILNEGYTMFKKEDPVIYGQGPTGFSYPMDPLDLANQYNPMD